MTRKRNAFLAANTRRNSLKSLNYRGVDREIETRRMSMKRLFGAAAAAVAVATHASAGDLPLQRRSYAPPETYRSLFNWTGFYLGVHGGYGWGHSGGSGTDPAGFV